ncbi:DUF159-domain-containing protein [Schizophyllum commune Loenen D]|nr:DUF159-domain-containing protein [Schizophyllum commune Loenen D]
MCGRFAFARSRTQIRQNVTEDLGHDVDEWVDEDNFYPRYNVAPRTYSPVLRSRDSSPSSSSSGESEAGDAATAAGTSQPTTQSNEPHFILQSMRWGVVPHWSKEDTYQMNTINARAENLLEGGGMWASLKGSKRCVVPCEGYYEWLTKSPKTKLPHFLKHKNNHLMYFAGLWDSVHLPNSSIPLYTFSIITTSAPSAYAWLHDRQPVILSSAKEIETWLNPTLGWGSDLARLLKPYKGEELDCYQVPQEVGKVGNESPAFVQPITERKDGIEAMFKKQVKKDAKEEKQATNIEVGDKRARKVKKDEEDEGSSATPSRKGKGTPAKEKEKLTAFFKKK